MSLGEELTRKVGLRERKDFAALNDPDAISGSATTAPTVSLFTPPPPLCSLARSSLRPFRPSAKRKRFLFAFIQNADRRQNLVNGRTNGFHQVPCNELFKIFRRERDSRSQTGLEAKVALSLPNHVEDSRRSDDLKISWVVAPALSLLSKFPALSVLAASRDSQCRRSSSSSESRQSAFFSSPSSFAMTRDRGQCLRNRCRD